MGIITKIFGNEKGRPATDDEIIVHKRAPRIYMIPLHDVVFDQKHPLVERSIKIANLSASGVGFIRSACTSWPTTGTIIRGDFVIEGNRVPMAARLVHISPMVVGCAYEGETVQIEKMVQRFFKIELEAARMTEVKASKRDGPKGKVFWFRGDGKNELFLIEDETGIVEFNLLFSDNFICFGESGKPSFGRKVKDLHSSKPTQLGSSVIKVLDSVSKQTLEDAMKFTENLQALSCNLRSNICSYLDRARKD